MSSAAGGYGGGAGSGAESHCHGHGDFMLHHHAQHVAAQQLYHVPQHSRREKLRFPPDDSPPHASASAPQQQHAGVAWPPPPPPPAFYSYASSSTSSYSPHSPTLALAQAQLVVAHGLAPPLSSQIPTQNFALSLSSSSSNPPPAPPQPRRAHAAPSAPFGPFTGYAAVLGRSRFLVPAEKLLEEICDVGGAASHVDRSVSDEGLLDADPMEAIDHDMDGADRAASDAGPISGAEQQWKKTRLISMMEEVSSLWLPCLLALAGSLQVSRAIYPPWCVHLFFACFGIAIIARSGWRRILLIQVTSPLQLWPAFVHCSCMCF